MKIFFKTIIGTLVCVGSCGAMPPPVPITNGSLPLTVTANTRYIVTEPLNFTGPGQSAIIVSQVENVEIDFAFHELQLQSDQIHVGINVAPDSSHIAIKRGKIFGDGNQNPGLTLGVFAQEFSDVTIEDMVFANLDRGIAGNTDQVGQQAKNHHLTVLRSTFNATANQGQRGISYGSIQDALIRDCSFLNCENGIRLSNNYANVHIETSSFIQCNESIELFSIDNPTNGFYFVFPSENAHITGCQFSRVGRMLELIGGTNTVIDTCSAAAGENPLFALVCAFTFSGPQARGLQIKNSSFTMGDGVNSVAHIAFGDIAPNTGVRDVLIENSSFTNRENTGNFRNILASQAAGLAIENCIFDAVGLARQKDGCPLVDEGMVPQKSANIQLGNNVTADVTDVQVEDVTIRESMLLGKAQVGVYSDTCSGLAMNRRIEIDNCAITAQEAGVLMNNTTSSTVMNCCIQQVVGNPFATGVGILINGATQCNPQAMSPRNVVCDNIVANNTLGIVVEQNQVDNVVTGNKVHSNSECQISSGKSLACDNICCGKDGSCCVFDKTCPINGRVGTDVQGKLKGFTLSELKDQAVEIVGVTK